MSEQKIVAARGPRHERSRVEGAVSEQKIVAARGRAVGEAEWRAP